MIDGAFDANVLIDFAGIDAISTLASFLDGKASVVGHVRRTEFSKGKLKGLPDPCIIEGQEWVQVIDDLDTDEYQMSNELVLRLGEQHKGEADTIAVCYHRKLVFCSRDKHALKIAYNRGIAVATTTTLLNEMIKHGHLPHAHIVAMANKLQSRGINPKDLLPELRGK